MITTSENVGPELPKNRPKCFGKLFDPNVDECSICDESRSCRDAQTTSGIPSVVSPKEDDKMVGQEDHVPEEAQVPEETQQGTDAVPEETTPPEVAPETVEVTPKVYREGTVKARTRELLFSGEWYTREALTEIVKGEFEGKGAAAVGVVIADLRKAGVLQSRQSGKTKEYHVE